MADQAHSGDPVHRTDAETIGHETGARALSRPLTPARECGSGELPAGTRLGPWRIERLAGRGGMGEVYEARRADGTFEMRAAVKLLKRGLDTDAVVARFNRERRILAQLDHPNIAHVLDAGVAPDSRPFLVMEYVEGMPITEYVRSRNLPSSELLQLAITACEAVQAAHTRRIVHRDLKPSNVLVTAHGQVKLLDFGIAKALAEEDADATRLAGEASIMTPAYAAPEQLLGAPATPATDVYALGVILYQLLVERLPHTRGGRPTHDIVRGLDKETVERPSAVLRKDRGRLPEPLRLARIRLASGDLDLIVLKALHAEASHRYGDAHALAGDLQRLLDHRPVMVRPDSAAYRINRYVRRNRLPVAVAAAVILALSVGLAAALWQAKAAILARNDATQRRQQADDLINFMLGDLKNRLDEVGRLDLLDATISKAVSSIGSGDPARLDDETLAERIAVLDHIGQIQLARGQVKNAVAAGRAAVDAARELQGRRPGTRSRQLTAVATYRLAHADDVAADFVSAEPLLAQGLDLAQRLLAEQPQNADLVLLAAKYDQEIADNADIGPHHSEEVSDTHWRACLDRLRPMVDQPGVKPQLVGQLIMCESGWVTHLSYSNDFEGRRRAAAAFVTEAQAVNRRYKDVAFVRHDIVQGLSAVAEVQASMGAAASVRPSALALEIGRELIALEPGNMEWLHSYANALLFDLMVKIWLKSWTGAQADADQALPLFQKVLDYTPDDVGTRLGAMELRGLRAYVDYAALHRRDLAVADTTSGLSLLRDGDQNVQLQVSGKLNLLLEQWFYALGAQPKVARKAREAALQLLDELAERPDVGPLDVQRTDADYLNGQCAEGDRLRVKLVAEHDPNADWTQLFRDAGCGKAGTPRRRKAGRTAVE